MKKSALQLVRYFVTEISCAANKNFAPGKEPEYSPDQFIVKKYVSETEDGQWMVQMTIQQHVGPQQNFPYEFKLAITGIFTCSDELPGKVSKDVFVEVNGCSILYGVSREMIRATTARGPFRDLMVPTVSFYEAPDESSVTTAE